MSILVVGSVALDSIRTPFGRRSDILGGSATFFSIAASFFNRVDIVATVGSDFPERHLDIFRKRHIGLDGLEVRPGKTFRWKGFYEYDLNTAHTISTHLNVFSDFDPRVPRHLRSPDILFLANIDPSLQHSVLRQIERPRLVACDSMNYWIANKRRDLVKLLRSVDILLVNDAEARQLSGEANLLKASRAILRLGPKAVVIKRGEYGVIYFSRLSHFVAPAYLLEKIFDPTGAGDTFAGGLIGYLSRSRRCDDRSVRKGIVYGSVLASFTVEGFSVSRLIGISMKDIGKRYDHFRAITRF
jgi:sugar/nucleoside kinase (ribokinase family)